MKRSEHPDQQDKEKTAELEEWYRAYRDYAFAIAYRMLGTAADAEDVVQDCFAALQRALPDEVQNAKAYITRITVNRCLNLLHSARKQRETYVGEWLPEPVGAAAAAEQPEAWAERKSMVSYAFLVLLERLKPVERAVFVLREAFQYEYKEIAELLGLTDSNCRQLYSRSRKRLAQDLSAVEGGSSGEDGLLPPITPTDDPSRKRMLERFTAAFMSYDVPSMLELLAEQPVFISDGGGIVHTVMRPMTVRKGVLALLTSRRILTRLRETEASTALLNGEEQLVFRRNGQTVAALCLEFTIDGKHIRGFYLMVNPQKLGYIR
ncbi:sigma-70 family RNA polymerase sigma factor [Paenibacillus sp. P96]|uniref:Sigma-70 family RNA polymerase sigma factor n=1 Tax=Paenibacillus zeirhizosphaerae TaxID=2987519 RepID=A0ABT9FUY4_9BACL|nr:sigma-70 family RNA polymerase sigma factor [Paenibacillus sp. P96]MDP4098538.1 sigma-70 family RNA polymerase sigma factor [Paenibacillus sp. P96]